MLAALEEEGFVGMVVGADPALEGVADGLLGSEQLAGLLGDGRVLVGKGLARQHGIEAGAELAVVGQDIDGSIASALYEVAAVVESPVELVNSIGIVAGLQDAQALLRMEDEAHEIAVRLHEAEQIRSGRRLTRRAAGTARGGNQALARGHTAASRDDQADGCVFARGFGDRLFGVHRRHCQYHDDVHV